jgi:hypothetical protein
LFLYYIHKLDHMIKNKANSNEYISYNNELNFKFNQDLILIINLNYKY